VLYLLTEQSQQTIELQLAILSRRLITSSKKIGTLDRSAYLLLHQITSHGSAGVKELADEFKLDVSTVSRQAAALEQKGYVERVPDSDDGRAFSLQITEAGMSELLLTRQARLARVKELMADWPEEEQALFGRMLARFNRNLLE
jgi:DNA-binding MarR family transcriptional regulator